MEITELLAALRFMPMLTKLTLLGVLQRHPLTMNELHAEVVELQQVVLLHLKDNVANLLWYLDHLQFRAETNLRLEVLSDSGLGNPVDKLTTFCQRLTSLLEAMTYVPINSRSTSSPKQLFAWLSIRQRKHPQAVSPPPT